MFEYKKGTRMTSKFVAEQSEQIRNVAQSILDGFGANATIKATVYKSSGRIWASVKLLNGSGPGPVTPILSALKKWGISATPMTTSASNGLNVESFTMFSPEGDWVIVAPETGASV